MNDTGALALVAVLGGFAVVFFIIAIICYVVGSYGLMKAAQNVGVENAWLAWIPFGNVFVLGKIVKDVSIGSLKITNLPMVLLIGSIAVLVLIFIPVFGTLLSIAFVVLTYFVYYKLYRLYNDKNAVLFLVLSLVLPFLLPFFLFSFRNMTPDYSRYA